MELRQLRYFVTVAEERGFAKAAARLGIVQSAVSQQVRRLERGLGVPLFTRTTRTTRLTAAGERLLPEAHAVLAAAERTRRVAAEIAAGTTGVLRLGTLNDPRVHDVLAALAAPGVEVRLTQVPPAERLAAVGSGRLDAALVRAATPTRDLATIPVWTDPLYAALPADHPLAAEPEPDPEHFAALPLRLAPPDRNPPFHRLVTAALPADQPLGPEFTTLQRTLADLGRAAPSWTVLYRVSELPAAPNIAYRRLSRPTVTTSLVVLRRSRNNPLLRAFGG
ncbi:LysR family transcriptional regulator [Actinosynnema sp. NPDC047251]|uniref:Transcriptional regulator, LysR family n=1 Tax=Saccharothrix espanaensis (strain ATCC 51144 / DSM 44229 / JCM 9112 / NBRC 15066 / NRRL 15764) TaxID=1179773 RepID=K0JUT9_SACES|nr:LysR family transcriptional regulator [Saccharothrix espanaensis]CCH29726.1 Transcriptional regulator, LysR family [Saccharothrix espanaensis DSM 44229]